MGLVFVLVSLSYPLLCLFAFLVDCACGIFSILLVVGESCLVCVLLYSWGFGFVFGVCVCFECFLGLVFC